MGESSPAGRAPLPRPPTPCCGTCWAPPRARGLLRVPVDDAAEQLLAANVGVTLSLITQPEETRGDLA